MVNLPQNIQKSDGAIARSFSQELGLNLDFKTGRKAIIQTEEHTGGTPLIMKNNSIIATINNNNQVVTWSIKHCSIIHIFESINTEVKSYYKLNENEIIVIGNDKIGVFNVNSGSFNIKIEEKSSIMDTAIGVKQKSLAVTCNYKSIQEVKLYSLESFQLLHEISLPQYEAIAWMTYAVSSNTLGLTTKSRHIYLYNTENFNLTYDFDGSDIKCSHFLDYSSNGTLFYEGQDGWFYKLHIDTDRLKPVLGSTSKIYFAENVILTAKFHTASTVLETYSTSDYSQIGKIKLGDSGIDKINIDNDFIIGYKRKRNQPGSIFIFDMNLDEIAEINFTISSKLDQYGSNPNVFGFSDSVFNLKTGILNEAKKGFRQELLGNWVDSGYFVTIDKNVNQKSPVVTFQCNKTGVTHLVDFYEIAGFKPDLQKYNVHIQFLYDSNIWLIKLLNKGIVFYDANQQKLIKALELNDYNKSSILLSKDLNLALTSATKTSAYEPGNCKIQLLSIKDGILIAEYNFTSYSNKFNYYFNSTKQSIVLFVLTKTFEGDAHELIFHEFDLNLNLKSTNRLGTYSGKDISFTKTQMLFCEQRNYLFFTENEINNKKLYKADLNNLQTYELCSFEHYKTGDLALSKNTSTLAFCTDYEIHVYNTLDNTLIGRINNKQMGKYFFSNDSNLLLVGAENKIDFYKIETLKKVGSMYIEKHGDYYVELLPDKTSPNGWFYTNNTEKVNVFKTKMDGSEPELLPVNNEDRLAFIKHHNRKDIVMNKLFEPEKYTEFAKLNANAEGMAKQDMAIELSKVEVKKLQN